MPPQILNILDLPDDPTALAKWLDQQLVGSQLTAVVAELQAIHGKPAAPSSLDQITAAAWRDIARNGTAALSSAQTQSLLRQPELLLELQQKVLREGGPYWDELLKTDASIDAATERGRRRLTAVQTLRKLDRSTSIRPRWFARPLLASLAAAALVLIAVGIWHVFTAAPTTQSVAEAPWGWQKPGVLAANVTRADYLNRLATAADEWFDKKPANVAELADRLTQLRRGCSTLILANHTALPPADQKWLKQKCQAWAANIDQHLVALEGGKPFDQVQADADATVRKLSHAIRDQATKA